MTRADDEDLLEKIIVVATLAEFGGHSRLSVHLTQLGFDLASEIGLAENVLTGSRVKAASKEGIT